jgi:hypothetical protein
MSKRSLEERLIGTYIRPPPGDLGLILPADVESAYVVAAELRYSQKLSDIDVEHTLYFERGPGFHIDATARLIPSLGETTTHFIRDSKEPSHLREYIDHLGMTYFPGWLKSLGLNMYMPGRTSPARFNRQGYFAGWQRVATPPPGFAARATDHYCPRVFLPAEMLDVVERLPYVPDTTLTIAYHRR